MVQEVIFGPEYGSIIFTEPPTLPFFAFKKTLRILHDTFEFQSYFVSLSHLKNPRFYEKLIAISPILRIFCIIKIVGVNNSPFVSIFVYVDTILQTFGSQKRVFRKIGFGGCWGAVLFTDYLESYHIIFNNDGLSGRCGSRVFRFYFKRERIFIIIYSVFSWDCDGTVWKRRF